MQAVTLIMMHNIGHQPITIINEIDDTHFQYTNQPITPSPSDTIGVVILAVASVGSVAVRHKPHRSLVSVEK